MNQGLTTRLHTRKWILALFCGLTSMINPCHAGEWPFFHPDDPMLEDYDRIGIDEPEEIELNRYYDFIENTFFSPGGKKMIRALNANSVDEVPNSSWFTNRHGTRRMSREELKNGPRQGRGPSMKSPWTIIRAKSEGITPGFVIRDGLGEIYFIKFDPKDHPEMATSAEIISTGFFHAIGYNVPQNYLAYIDSRSLEISPEAKIKDKRGRSKEMSREDLGSILQKAPVGKDGKIRVVASRAIDGKPLGHYRYYGTRPDDGNDIIPHQHRRELRGLRVFAAWLNHDDTRAINSLDVFVAEGEKGHVMHYLIDFGSCLGSGSVMPQTRRAGNEYMLDWVSTFKTMATMGLWVRPYLKIKYPDHPSIGRFESVDFRPERWVPEYPNPAFDRMDMWDAFWAARIVIHFTDEDVRTLVEEGMLSDQDAEEYLIRTLCERRDKIGGYYFGATNPLSDFLLDGDILRFSNLAVRYDFDEGPGDYAVDWWKYDNRERLPVERMAGPSFISGESIEVPETLLNMPFPSYSFLEIRSSDMSPPGSNNPVRVFFRHGEGRVEIVGITRE